MPEGFLVLWAMSKRRVQDEQYQRRVVAAPMFSRALATDA